MSPATDGHQKPNTNHEQRSNLSDESKASVDADLEPSAVKQEAADERLQILIHGPLPQSGKEPDS